MLLIFSWLLPPVVSMCFRANKELIVLISKQQRFVVNILSAERSGQYRSELKVSWRTKEIDCYLLSVISYL